MTIPSQDHLAEIQMYHARNALRELLKGQLPDKEDTLPLTGDVCTCIEALIGALHTRGVRGIRVALTDLVQDRRPWLGHLTADLAPDLGITAASAGLPAEADRPIIRALQELLAGHEPDSADVSALTGEVRACIDALCKALRSDGVAGVRKAFLALNKDHPWLGKLAAAPEVEKDDAAQPERRIRWLPTSELLHRPRQQWLIPNILPRDGVALVYGLSGAYKSFLVMDWSLCIATGTPWLGRSVVHGPVAYLAAEGSYGIGKRVLAWMAHHHRTFHTDQELDALLAIRWFDQAIALQDTAQVAELITSLQVDFAAVPPALIVIDTLSRCSAGADEDSNSDMARVIAGADFVRQQFQCTVLIVHHVGKDLQRGPRGASALMGNAETLIYVSPTMSGNMVESAKAKDAPRFEPIYLDVQEVQFGQMPDETSLVLVQGHAETAEPLRPASHTTILACLAGKRLAYGDLLQACLDAGQKEGTFKKAFGALKTAGLICKMDNLWQIDPSVPGGVAAAVEDATGDD